VVTEEIPFVAAERRVELRPLGKGLFRLVIRFGFMDAPDVPSALALCSSPDFAIDRAHVSYFVSRETIVPSLQPGIALWREKIFALMSRLGQSATDFFKIPSESVVELGTQVEI
jgi:KUP system potassium uptake protein